MKRLFVCLLLFYWVACLPVNVYAQEIPNQINVKGLKQEDINKEVNQAVADYKAERYAEALLVFEKYFKELASAFKDKPDDLRSFLTIVATCYQKTGKQKQYEELLPYIQKEETATTKEGSWESFNQAGLKAYKAGNYLKTKEHWEKAKIQAEKEFGTTHANYATSCNNLALLYQSQGLYTKAEPLYIEAKNIRENVLGKQHLDYATSSLNLATLYRSQGLYAQAETLFMEAKNIYENVLGKRHSNYANSCDNLALLYQNQGFYAKAESLYIEAKEIREKSLGKKHPNYATSCNNLASLYQSQGFYAKAESLYIEAKNIREKVLGKEHIDYATSCNDLARLYKNQGLYAKAEPLYIEAKNIEEKVFGKQHPDYATSCHNLAALYNEQGLYAKAELLYIEAKNIYEKTLGKDHFDYAGSCNNLAALYNEQGLYAKAELLYIEAKSIEEKVLGKKHLSYATYCHNLGVLYSNQGLYAKAEPLYIEAKNIREKVLGKEHPDYAISCNSLAILYKKQGLYAKAEPLIVEAKNIREKALGKQHPDYATSCNSLASLYESQGLYAQAEPLRVASNQALLTQIEVNFSILSEKEKGIYYNTFSNNLETFNRFAINRYQENPAIAVEVYNNTLVTKALLFNAGNKIRESISQSNDQNLKNLYQLWKDKKENLAKVYALSLEEKTKKSINVPQLESEANELEKQLSQKSALFANANDKKRYMWLDVQKKLKKDEVAIEIIRSYMVKEINEFQVIAKGIKYTAQADNFPIINEILVNSNAEKAGLQKSDLIIEIDGINTKGKKNEELATLFSKRNVKIKYLSSIQNKEVLVEIVADSIFKKVKKYPTAYMALIIKPESKYPEMIVLENGNELEEKYAKNYQNCIKGKATDKYSYVQYWSSIHKKLQGVKKVYLSVDGVYNGINLNTLKNPETGKYVSEEVEIQLVSNTKDIVLPTVLSPKEKNKVVLIGFPDYNNKSKAPKSSFLEDKKVVLDSTQRFFDGSNISELVGTKTEVENIAKMLQKAKIVTQSYMEGQASEGVVKKLDSPYILHIATHGFFMKDVEKNKEDERGLMGMDSKTVFENPLLRAGLLFANAKEALQDGSDGVLTAYEAMNLNLDNTDLVVMSACETGLGEVRNGEGVYGLQRAFQQAGAKTVLMSLWTVSDDATQELMTLFYENLIMKKQSKRLAFQNAQSELKKKFPEPYYWGAFVMVGE